MVKIDKFIKIATTTFSCVAISLVLLPGTPAQATMSFNCSGSFSNKMKFAVRYVDGRFTTITLTPKNGPPRTNPLKYDRRNNKGELIYRGGDMGAADITVIDLSAGAAKPGTQVSVMLDSQWARGTCKL